MDIVHSHVYLTYSTFQEHDYFRHLVKEAYKYPNPCGSVLERVVVLQLLIKNY